MNCVIKVIKEMLEKKIGKRLAKEIICILLLSFGVSRKEIMEKIGASHTTLCKYNKLMEESRLSELFEAKLHKPTSELEKYSAVIEEEFASNPPKTRSEAQERIERLTGLRRSLPAIGNWLKKKA